MPSSSTSAPAPKPPHVNDPRWQVAAQVPPTKADYPIWTDAIDYAIENSIASGHHIMHQRVEEDRGLSWSLRTRWISVATAAKPMTFKEHKPVWPCWLFSDDRKPNGANDWIPFADHWSSAKEDPSYFDRLTDGSGEFDASYTHWLPGDETQKPEAKPVWRALKIGELKPENDRLVGVDEPIDIFAADKPGNGFVTSSPGLPVCELGGGSAFRRIADEKKAPATPANVWRQMDPDEDVNQGDVYTHNFETGSSPVDLTNADRPSPGAYTSFNWQISDRRQSQGCTYFRRIAVEVPAPAPAPVSTTQVPTFEKGDRVVLTSTTHGDRASNPVWGGAQGFVAGTVTETFSRDPVWPGSPGEKFTTEVRWDNGQSNSYRTAELGRHADQTVANRKLSRGSQRPLPKSLALYQEVKDGAIKDGDILRFSLVHYEWADGLIGDPVNAPGVLAVLRLSDDKDPVQTAPGVFKLPETAAKPEEKPSMPIAIADREPEGACWLYRPDVSIWASWTSVPGRTIREELSHSYQLYTHWLPRTDDVKPTVAMVPPGKPPQGFRWKLRGEVLLGTDSYVYQAEENDESWEDGKATRLDHPFHGLPSSIGEKVGKLVNDLGDNQYKRIFRPFAAPEGSPYVWTKPVEAVPQQIDTYTLATSLSETIGSSLKAQVRTLQSKNARQAAAVRDLEEKNRKLREASAEKTQRIEGLKEELGGSYRVNQSQQQTINELREVLSTRGSQLNRRAKEIEGLKAQYELLKSAIPQAQQEILSQFI